MKYFLITFGCQMQKSDSERIASVLKTMGYERCFSLLEANLLVVNMCAVRQSAVDRVYGLRKKIIKKKEENPDFKSLLTGCVPQKDIPKLKSFFDYILPIKTLPLWPEFLQKEHYFYFPDQKDKSFLEKFSCDYFKIPSTPTQHFSVFIPISTGCDNFCSYCIVLFVRGPLLCRDHQEILEEVKSFIEKGAKEIWLLGQNVNDYHSPTNPSVDFSRLLKMVNEIKGNFWVRFTSPHPKNFSAELVKTMAQCQKVAPYLNLPLQSGDNEILKKMNRPYTVEQYINLVKNIRLAFRKYRRGLEKEISLSTDIIVGFPGETKKQFENTVKVFKKIKFDMAYIAQYSPRPGTAAEKMEDNVSKKEKERRWKILTRLLKKIALKKNKKFLGKVVEVLPEKTKNGFLIGKTRHYKTVKFKGGRKLIGDFVLVKIEKVLDFGFEGKIFIAKND